MVSSYAYDLMNSSTSSSCTCSILRNQGKTCNDAHSIAATSTSIGSAANQSDLKLGS